MEEEAQNIYIYESISKSWQNIVCTSTYSPSSKESENFGRIRDSREHKTKVDENPPGSTEKYLKYMTETMSMETVAAMVASFIANPWVYCAKR